MTKNYQADAFEQMGNADGTANTYDALNRLVRAGDSTLAYLGSSRTVAAAGPWSYTHTPDGNPLGATNGGATGLAWTDAHTDLIGLVDPATGTLAGSRSYDPFGQRTATTGAEPSVGYQHQYTDPASGAVNMGSRWYAPDTGTFTSRDTIGLDPRDTANANRYGYGASAPLTHVDLDGHLAFLGALLVAGVRLGAKYLPKLLKGSSRAAGALGRGRGRGMSALWRPVEQLSRLGKQLSRLGKNLSRNGKNLSRAGKNLRSQANPGPGRVQHRPPNYSGGRGLSQGRGASGSRLSEQASRARTITQRANTRAPRPNAAVKGLTATERVRKAGAALWAAANSLDNAIDLGNLDIGGDGDEAARYIPELVDEPDANVVAGLTEPMELPVPTDLETLDDEDCRPHTVNYGTIINKQRTGIQACLTEPMPEGSIVPDRFFPPGYKRYSGLHRSHLLGKQLGGSGKEPANVVTLFREVNTPAMRGYENMVRDALRAPGAKVMYTSKPLYRGPEDTPSAVWLTATVTTGSRSRS